MATLVVHPGGWSRWSTLSVVVGSTDKASLTPETLFWGTPRVGQGLSRLGLTTKSGVSGPFREGSLLVWSTSGASFPGVDPVQSWLVQVGKVLGYF